MNRLEIVVEAQVRDLGFARRIAEAWPSESPYPDRIRVLRVVGGVTDCIAIRNGVQVFRSKKTNQIRSHYAGAVAIMLAESLDRAPRTQ